MKAFLLILQIWFAFWMKWAQSDAEKKQKAKDLKGEAEDAIKSKDIARVHATIERINRL